MYLREGGGGLGRLETKPNDKHKTGVSILVPCIPVETLLLALNQSTVDYFSLDVEGLEYDVIRSLPLRKFDIRSWSVEYSHTNHVALKKHLFANGYAFKRQLNVYDKKVSLVVEDYIFVKKSGSWL